jgi:hypothetical protein
VRADSPTVGDWYAAHRGRVPIQLVAALSRYVARDGVSVDEAYRRLVSAGAIIPIREDDQKPR